MVGDEERILEFGEGGFDVGGGSVEGEFEGDVAGGAGELGEVGDGFFGAEEVGEFGEIEFGEVGFEGEVEFAAAGRSETTEDADVGVAEVDGSGEEVVREVLRLEAEGEVGGEGGEDGFEVEEVGRSRMGGGPAGGCLRPGEEDAEDGEFVVGFFAAAEVTEAFAGLEETDGLSALARIVGCGGDEPRCNRRAEDGVVLGEREGDADEVGFLERFQRKDVVELGLGDEFDGLSFEEALGGEVLLESELGVVGVVGGTTGNGVGGVGDGDAVEADDADDFFDEVDGAGKIGAIGGDVPSAVFVGGEAEGSKAGGGFFLADGI